MEPLGACLFCEDRVELPLGHAAEFASQESAADLLVDVVVPAGVALDDPDLVGVVSVDNSCRGHTVLTFWAAWPPPSARVVVYCSAFSSLSNSS